MRANFIHIEELLRGVIDLEGDIAEFGVWYGTTFMPMAELARLKGRTIHAVDSFIGFAERTDRDGDRFYAKGKLSANGTRTFKTLTRPFNNVVIHEGFVPDILKEMANISFSFVHLDLDQYAPTIESLKFLWGRMVSGGVIACHDWNCDSDMYAAGAIKDWMEYAGVGYPVEQEYSSHCWFTKP